MDDNERKIIQSSYACKRCASCRDWSFYDPGLAGFDEDISKTGYTICPVFKHSDGFESDYARGRLRIARGVLENKLEIGKELIQKIYNCTTCGNCAEHCPQTRQGKMNPLETILSFRQMLFSSNERLPGGLRRIAGKAEELQGIPEKWIPHSIRNNGRRSKIGYFPGCSYPSIVSHKFPDIAGKFLGALGRLNIEYQVIDEGLCCGYMNYSAGDINGLERIALQQKKILQERGITLLVTTCAGCYYMFSKVYGEIDGWWRTHITIQHATQMLADQIERTPVKLVYPGQALTVTYHDPCDLGRKSHVYEEPRYLIQKIENLELREFPQNRENSFCCGAGSGLKVVNSNQAKNVANDRFQQAEELGVDKVITACPACLWSLSEASMISESRNAASVSDLHAVIFDAMS